MIDLSKVQYYSGYEVDQIIGVFTGSMSVGAPTSGQGSLSVTHNIPHGFGDSAYFQGIFSVDGGSTWNDFGTQTPYFGGGLPTFQTADCNASVDTTNASVTAISWYDYTYSRSQAYNFTYKIFMIAKNTMASPITPINITNNVSFSSRYNYQKIAAKGSANLSVAYGTTGSVTVSHSLGYIPKVRAWWFDSGSGTTCRPIYYRTAQVKISTTNIVFYIDNTFFGPGITYAGRIEYRIYYD